ncbi:MAG: sulfite exporter TauE/SafE family protein [Flavonifractor plautii]
MLVKFIVCVVAGLGAGIGTGLAGLSAAAVISPMLYHLPGFPLLYQKRWPSLWPPTCTASAAFGPCSPTGKNRNHGYPQWGWSCWRALLVFTLIGSWAATTAPNATMGGFSVFMTLLLGIKFIVRPVMTTKESSAHKSRGRRIAESLACGSVVGFICGFIGAGGGMMMLLVLTSVLGYELKTAVGTQCVHHDLHRFHRRGLPRGHRRRAGCICPDGVCGGHASGRQNCRRLC